MGKLAIDEVGDELAFREGTPADSSEVVRLAASQGPATGQDDDNSDRKRVGSHRILSALCLYLAPGLIGVAFSLRRR